MKTLGIATAAGGLLIAFASLLMKTSVHSEGVASFGTYVPSADTLNLGLLQNQHMAFEGGLALFLAGIVVFGAGAIVEALAPNRLAVAETPAVDSQSTMTSEPRLNNAGYGVDHARNTKLFLICSAVFIGMLVIAILMFGGAAVTPGAGRAVVENSGEQLADNLEAQADNLLAEEAAQTQ